MIFLLTCIYRNKINIWIFLFKFINYELDELKEKLCIAVVNLGNKQIGPFMSECLVLGSIAENGDVLLLQPSDKAELGDKVS